MFNLTNKYDRVYVEWAVNRTNFILRYRWKYMSRSNFSKDGSKIWKKSLFSNNYRQKTYDWSLNAFISFLPFLPDKLWLTITWIVDIEWSSSRYHFKPCNTPDSTTPLAQRWHNEMCYVGSTSICDVGPMQFCPGKPHWLNVIVRHWPNVVLTFIWHWTVRPQYYVGSTL